MTAADKSDHGRENSHHETKFYVLLGLKLSVSDRFEKDGLNITIPYNCPLREKNTSEEKRHITSAQSLFKNK